MRAVDPAKLDLDREARTGIPEIVLAEGKTDADLGSIVARFHAERGFVLVSRLAPERAALLAGLPHTYDAAARFAVVGVAAPARTGGRVAVLAAGTADRAVAQEAAIVAEAMGCEATVVLDVGVAGIHRLLPELTWAKECHAIVAVAGREGTLPTVVAGLVDVPVIGVPVSTGYGVGGRGEAALFTMLQSCSPLTVVNVDAGVVAGACAAQIANRVARAERARAAMAAPEAR